jgi:O-antigen/teichoic acid export membrane protein
MGLFSAAGQWRIAMLFLPASLGGIFLPILSNLFGNSEYNNFLKTCYKALTVTAIISLFQAIPILLFASNILKIYGKEFQNGYIIFVLNVVIALFISINNAFSRIIISTGRIWADFWMNLTWGLCCLFGSLLLIPKMGSLGLCLSLLCATLIQSIVLITVFVQIARSIRMHTIVAIHQ